VLIVVQGRGGRLQEIPIEHRAFDALYHVMLHPTGYNGYEDNYPHRSWRDIAAQLPSSALAGPAPKGQVLIIREPKCPCENTMHIGYIKGVGWAALTIVYL
jgi:hypothetical protein